MRILLVQDTDWIRKNPIQHNHLLERMVQRGHEVYVIDYEFLWRTEGKKELCSRRQVFHVSRIVQDATHTVIRPGILKIPILDYVSMLFTYRKEIKHLLKEFHPDVVIGDGLLTPFLAFPLAKKEKIKTIYYCIDRDYKLIPFRFLQPLGKILERYNIRNADRTFSINEGLRDYTLRMGADPKKTEVIRVGFDSQLFNPEITGDEIRKKYRIKKDDTVLFFMGWLYQFSGLKEVAIELSKIQDESIKLFIVGEGDAFLDLEKIREEYHLQNRVILAGQQPYEDLPQFIASADICLLPAYNNEIMQDIVPIKMYEYMAMGKPIISTKLPGIMKEFGTNHGVVYIEKPEDAMINAMYLIEHNTVKIDGEKARKFVEHNDWQIITDEFERVLRECI